MASPLKAAVTVLELLRANAWHHTGGGQGRHLCAEYFMTAALNEEVVHTLAELSVASPLKAALTGLELLLARAQLWEDTAGAHVSLGEVLRPAAALAARWRTLELSSWRGLLVTTIDRFAAGALDQTQPKANSMQCAKPCQCLAPKIPFQF